MQWEWRQYLAETRDAHQSGIAVGTLLLLAVILGLNIALSAMGISWIPIAREVLLFDLGIVYPLGIAFLGLVLLFLFVSPWGGIVLGDENSTREYGNLTYFAMLFSANLAAGIAFFGPGEAVFYLEAVPPGIDAGASSFEIAQWGVGFTLIHWGLFTTFTHYVIAPAFAYYCYRRGAPFRISSALYPVVQDRPVVAGIIDVVGIVIIVLGLASSVAEVTSNFLAGIKFQWVIADPTVGTVLFLIAVTLVFTASAVTGFHRGIPRLSVLSVVWFAVIAVGVFVLGPTGTVLDLAVGATLAQPAQLATLATHLEHDWVANWTIFNWAIWITAATALGLFGARISYGRTIREFLAYSCVAAAVANMIWFYVIGGSVVATHLSGEVNVVELIKSQGFGVAGYPMFLSLPVGELFLFLFLGLGLLFLITLADSMMLGAAMTASNETASPPSVNRAVWGGVIGIVTIVLTIVGGIDGANMLAILGGLVIVLLCVASQCVLLRSLYLDDDIPDLL